MIIMDISTFVWCAVDHNRPRIVLNWNVLYAHKMCECGCGGIIGRSTQFVNNASSLIPNPGILYNSYGIHVKCKPRFE